MAEIWLLVERGRIQTERVDDVVNLDSTILDTLLGLLSRSIGTGVYFLLSAVVLYLCLALRAGRGRGIRTDFDGAESDHLAVDLVDNAINFLEIVGVGDDLVAGDKILSGKARLANRSPTFGSRFSKKR
jgi:hypothetical protein